MHQHSLFCAPPAVSIEPIDPAGTTVQDNSDIEFLTFGEFKLLGGKCVSQLTIELSEHIDGRWMWGVNAYTGDWSGGFKVGPKWGRFAVTRRDALIAAIEEMRAMVIERSKPSSTRFNLKDSLRWLDGLTPTQ